MINWHLIGDSARGQGSRSDQSPIGLSLTPGGIATHPRTGALSADLPLKHLSADGVSLSTRTTPRSCENGAAATKNVVARQRVHGIMEGRP